MNLPNALTCSRIVLTFFIIWLLLLNTFTGYIAATVLFVAAAVTDFYDGYFAKRLGLTTDWGKIMDPIADKVLMISVFAALAHIGIVAWWMVAVIALREIAVTVTRLCDLAQGRVSSAERAGKVKTVLQMLSVSLALLFLILSREAVPEGWFNNMAGTWRGLIDVCMLLSVAVTLYSGAQYFKNRVKV